MTDDIRTGPLMPTYPPHAVTFVRGQGSELWDDHGRRYLDFLSGLAVTSLGHAHPAVADALSEQARTLLHVSNLYGTAAGSRGRHHARSAPRRWRSGVLHQLGRRGQRVRHQAGPQVGWARSPRRGQRLRVLPRSDARHAPRHRPAGQARGVPAAAGGLPPRRLERPRRAGARRSIPTVAAVLLEPVQGEGGVNPATADYFAGRPAPVRRAGHPVHGRRGPDRARPHRSVVRPPALRACVPDVVTMAKALGNGVPIGACWARADVAGAFEPGDHATTYGGQPLAAAAARAVLADHGGRGRPGPGDRGRQAADRRAARAAPASAACEASACSSPPSWPTASTPRRSPPTHWTRGSSSTPSRPTALRLAPSLLISDERDRRGRRHPRRGPGGPRMTRHLLEIDDLTADELGEVLARGRSAGAVGRVLDGQGPPCSSRSRRPAPATRREMAVVQLGGHPIYVRPDEVGIDQRETPRTSPAPSPATTPSSAARVFDHAELRAHGRGQPGSRREPAVRREPPAAGRWPTCSPSQAELGTLAGRTVAWVGDFNNVARSLGLGRRPVGHGLRFACPPATARPTSTSTASPPPARPRCPSAAEPAEAVDGADVVTPTCGRRWARRTRPCCAACVRRLHGRRALMARAAADGIFLHCLPAHRGEEVAAEVLDGPRSRVWPASRQPPARRPRCLAWLVEQP